MRGFLTLASALFMLGLILIGIARANPPYKAEWDFNNDNVLDIDDIEWWYYNKHQHLTIYPERDINGDNQISWRDLAELMEFMGYIYGDFNMDGTLDNEDLENIYTDIAYGWHLGGAAGFWVRGDFNLDGVLDFDDARQLVLWAKLNEDETNVDKDSFIAKFDLTDVTGVHGPDGWITYQDWRKFYDTKNLDVDEDGNLTAAEPAIFGAWIGYPIGDANCDGVFDSDDITLIMQAGEYEDEIPNNSGWEEGDFNFDGDFTSEDLVWAYAEGDYQD